MRHAPPLAGGGTGGKSLFCGAGYSADYTARLSAAQFACRRYCTGIGRQLIALQRGDVLIMMAQNLRAIDSPP